MTAISPASHLIYISVSPTLLFFHDQRPMLFKRDTQQNFPHVP